MNTDPMPGFERYQSRRRIFETAFWLIFLSGNTAANSLVSLIDLRRSSPDFPAWEPIVWECSSTLLMLALIPAVVWFTRRFPLQWDNWRLRLPVYALASLAFSIIHVGGMIGMRELAYHWMGQDYSFGPWGRELFYEYLKDVRSFGFMIAIIEVYRFVLRRVQGEASLLQMPDVGPPLVAVDRPDRFLVRKLGREFLVAAADIEWLQASGNYVNLHVSGRDYPLRSTIANIEDRLDSRLFMRVHRSFIVNLDRIASIEPLETGDARLHMKDSATIPCSRRYRGDLRERAGANAAAETSAVA
jgi:DNA-binding LytR/AlgR family response regulator